PEQSISHLLALSVKSKRSSNPIVRFLIRREGSAFRVDTGNKSFNTLKELVEHYADRLNKSNMRLSFSVEKDQLVTRWEYNAEVIVKGDRLDGGSYGEVFKGTLFGTEIVALKYPDLTRLEAEDFMKEAEISRPCRHPNVLETFGVCRSQLFILTEYMKHGDLQKYLQRNGEISTAQCLSIAQKIASAMEYLHSMKIVHRDLAARNILVGETIDTIKVADFGFARSLRDTGYYFTQTEAFPLRWTAPEAYVIYEGIVNTKQGQITNAADVWSFGIVLWELYSKGQLPYRDIATDAMYVMLTENNYRLPRPAKCPEAIYAKMLECWNLDRKARPTFADLHSFLLAQPDGDEEMPEEEPAAAADAAGRLDHSDTDDEMTEEPPVYNVLNENA
ncbi:hypothetical protein PENTCL1PPCAC_16570, partial [Pristionchus entomophagus]